MAAAGRLLRMRPSFSMMVTPNFPPEAWAAKMEGYLPLAITLQVPLQTPTRSLERPPGGGRSSVGGAGFSLNEPHLINVTVLFAGIGSNAAGVVPLIRFAFCS